MSDYVGFENWIGAQISGDEIVNALHRMGVHPEEGASRDELMEAIGDVLKQIRDRELARGVSEKRAENIIKYFEKVLKPGSKSVRSRLRRVEVHAKVFTPEGDLEARTIGDIIDAPRLVSKQKLEERRREIRELREELPLMVGFDETTLEEKLREEGKSWEVINWAKQELARLKKQAESEQARRVGQEYVQEFTRINNATDRNELEDIWKDARKKFKNNPFLLSRIMNEYYKKRFELRRQGMKGVQKVTKEYARIAEAISKSKREGFEVMKEKYEQHFLRLYGEIPDPRRIMKARIFVSGIPREYVDWFREEYGKIYDRRKQAAERARRAREQSIEGEEDLVGEL
jgi:hypothetical protein